MLSAGADGNVILWDYANLGHRKTFKAHPGTEYTKDTGFTPKKAYWAAFGRSSEFATCGRDGKILLWDIRNPHKILKYLNERD